MASLLPALTPPALFGCLTFFPFCRVPGFRDVLAAWRGLPEATPNRVAAAAAAAAHRSETPWRRALWELFRAASSTRPPTSNHQLQQWLSFLNNILLSRPRQNQRLVAAGHCAMSGAPPTRCARHYTRTAAPERSSERTAGESDGRVSLLL